MPLSSPAWWPLASKGRRITELNFFAMELNLFTTDRVPCRISGRRSDRFPVDLAIALPAAFPVDVAIAFPAAFPVAFPGAFP